MKHACPFVSSRAHLRRDGYGLRVLRIHALYCSAPPAFFIFLQRLSWPPLSQCCFWHSGAAVAGAAADAFLAQ